MLPSRLSRLLMLVSIALITVGCMTVGPDYVAPTTELPETWHAPVDPALTPDETTPRAWWTHFEDPALDGCIEAAGEANRDLAVALARIEESRAQLGIARGGKLPVAGVGAEVTRTATSAGSGFDLGTRTLYSVAPSASWEIDLFGKIRRQVEAAGARYEATIEDKRDLEVALFAEVALTYLTMRTLEAQIAATEANLESQREVLELTRARRKHGLASDLEVAQAERLVASFEASVPALRRERAASRNALSVLMGKNPGTPDPLLDAPGPIPVPPEELILSTPAEMLRQRPDIRAAERRLAAQTARVGIATADLYPTLSLSALLGRESISTNNLFNASNRLWSLGASLQTTLFSGGRLRRAIEVEDARTEQALAGYEQTVLNALGEVENALTALAENHAEREALHRSLEAAETSVTLSRRLYKEGLVDFQNVLDASREQLELERRWAGAKGAYAAETVRLYRAFGGGWQLEPQ